tara:strand:+ start:81 stop:899 length:819 start_codon:yes stop_codon:yes gene_type:complete
MAYRQTTSLTPTYEQFEELFDLHKSTYWEHAAYTWYDPKKMFVSYDAFKEGVITWSMAHTTLWQMWWEDDTLLGMRSFLESHVHEDMAGGIIHTASDDGPIPKIIGDDPDWKTKTLKTDIFVGRPDSTGSQHNWMLNRPETAPTWNNNDGESLWEAMWSRGKERAYSCAHGSMQKQILWNNRDCEAFKHDIFLQMGYSFNERKQLGFEIDAQNSFIYRLIGGESMGWPKIHSLYHIDNAERPDKVERPYIASIDIPLELGIEAAPLPPETIG